MDGRKFIDETTLTLFDEQTKLGGVFLSKLAVGIHLEVGTKNSIYKLTILDGSMVNIEGGTRSDGSIRFPTPRPAIINGCNWGGAMMKMGWIGHNMNMEITESQSGWLMTSPVMSLKVSAPDYSWSYDFEWNS